MIDSHAHLYFERFDEDRDQVIARAREAGVSRLINIGIDVPTSEQSLALAREQKGFFAAAGLHPTSVIVDLVGDIARLEALARAHPEHVVAIGEIGLDYYWKEVAPADQRVKLDQQLDLARRLNLPVIFHCRDALDDLFAVLELERSLPPGVFHCFSGGPAEAERALGLGFHLSFAGNVTFPRANVLQAALAVVPLDKLLLETDCPFLAPQPCRGKRNEPAFVRHTRDFIASARGVSPEAVEAATDAAALRLFRLR